MSTSTQKRSQSNEFSHIKYIVIHCSATKPKMHVDIETIHRWHVARGFTKIGYHVVIKRDGTTQLGRELDEVGAHARGFNKESWGVCLVGGLDQEGKPANNFTSKQFDALKVILLWLKGLAPDAKILGHRDLPNVAKDCPCFDVDAWLSTWNEEDKDGR